MRAWGSTRGMDGGASLRFAAHVFSLCLWITGLGGGGCGTVGFRGRQDFLPGVPAPVSGRGALEHVREA